MKHVTLDNHIGLDGRAGTTATTHTISELSQRFGLTMRTLRFYEEKGLLKPARRGNRRLYSKFDADALADIVRLKTIGLPIADIQIVMNNVRSGKGERAREILLELARKRLGEIRAEMESLHMAKGYAESAVSRIVGGDDWFQST